MDFLQDYYQRFMKLLSQSAYSKDPVNLYEPIDYILQLGGKRVRPLLVYMAYDRYGVDIERADHAALAMEVFHNFTLVHDDIMDAAPLRRGKLTVHEKYDVNTGILSGDVMLIKAYELLTKYEPKTSHRLLQIFNKMATEVCEGQQMDMDFETRDDVRISEYLKMIEYKTSVLIASCLQAGALLGGATEEDANHLYHYGLNVGIAFQMQDDLLDTFGTDLVGKQDGGDIIQNKKTYLYLKTLELCSEREHKQLLTWYSQKPDDPQEKIDAVRTIFSDNHVKLHADEVKKGYRDLAYSHLEALKLEDHKKSDFKAFAEYLLSREV